MAGDYKKDHVRELAYVVEELELEGRVFLRCFSVDELTREYNGIGPEWLDAEKRGAVTKILTLFEPAALVHDMRNFMSDGTVEAFEFANREFLENCLKLANDRYSWWDPRRYRARGVARLLYAFVEGSGGWRAWMDCFNKNQKQKGKNEMNKMMIMRLNAQRFALERTPMHTTSRSGSGRDQRSNENGN